MRRVFAGNLFLYVQIDMTKILSANADLFRYVAAEDLIFNLIPVAVNLTI